MAVQMLQKAKTKAVLCLLSADIVPRKAQAAQLLRDLEQDSAAES